ncbi:MAG: hypothetical protein HKN44_00205 [Ilumatobacter sp.]|nr:hypothetical protein [Ilumatobacter sp.]
MSVPITDDVASRQTVPIRPWIDPVVDECGHDPRSRYVETFWLGVLGPTATWLLRRLAAGLERRPDGYELDLVVTARAMGLRFTPGRATPFSKALQRCVMFGLAHPIPESGLAVRRRVPAIAQRHLRRLPDSVQHEHARWERTTISLDDLTRAHQLAMAMVDVGDDMADVEHQLLALGVAGAVAAEVTDNITRLAAQRS